MTLNQGQQEASKAFDLFIYDPIQTEMVITGPPGTGKTFLVNYLINNMNNTDKVIRLLGGNNPIKDIELTATTHKAAKILQEGTSIPTQTIHSYLNLKVNKDFETGKTFLSKGYKYEIKKNALIIIDEASMIDTLLLKIIKESTMNCKILYIGDKNQLAPVFEPISPVFTSNIPTVELTEPMRFMGHIEELCARLNTGVTTTSFTAIEHKEGSIEYLERDAAKNKVCELFHPDNYSINSAKILTYTNDKTIDYNQFIRKNIWNLPDQITEGEFVICNNLVISYIKNHKGYSEIASVDSSWKVASIGETIVHFNVPCITITLDAGFHTLIPVCSKQLARELKLIAKTKDWKKFYALKESVADLRPTFSSTVHKSQGSTYDTVFVDLTDIGSCVSKSVVTRLLNVACSRAKSKIYLIGDLPIRYKG